MKTRIKLKFVLLLFFSVLLVLFAVSKIYAASGQDYRKEDDLRILQKLPKKAFKFMQMQDIAELLLTD